MMWGTQRFYFQRAPQQGRPQSLDLAPAPAERRQCSATPAAVHPCGSSPSGVTPEDKPIRPDIAHVYMYNHVAPKHDVH